MPLLESAGAPNGVVEGTCPRKGVEAEDYKYKFVVLHDDCFVESWLRWI